MPTDPLVTVVVPVLRDTEQLSGLLESLMTSPRARPDEVEVIVVDGGPGDASLAELQARHERVRWSGSEPGRAIQMNAGAELARGRWLLFLHADVRPDDGWLDELRRLDRTSHVGGAFAFRLASGAVWARWLERGVALRVRWLGLPYGDQGIFVRREAFRRLGGYSRLPIMEDIELLRRLRRVGTLTWSAVPVSVSARRWERDGWMRRSLANLVLVALYFAGASPAWLARRYYGPPQANRPGPAPPVGSVAVVIPALNEEEAIGEVLAEIPSVVDSVTVVDNGSTDRTAERALAGGARVVEEPRPGYGRACLAGLDVTRDADVIVFLDADRSDYPEEMIDLLEPLRQGTADLVLGYREGVGRPWTARAGTSLCVWLINRLWGTAYRDLGPFRAIRREALDRLCMVDQTWGWTIEMQVKAAEAGLRILEVPVRQRPRLGHSKISGTVIGTLRAGSRMLGTITGLWLTRRQRDDR